MEKAVSFRFDALSFTINPRKNIETEMGNAGYVLRERTKYDKIRSAQGYNKENAKILDFAPIGQVPHGMLSDMVKKSNIDSSEEDEPNKNDEFVFGLTVSIRDEYSKNGEKPRSGFISMSGGQMDYIDFESLIIALNSIIKGSRVDVACDIVYKTTEELDKEFNRLMELSGFDPKKTGFKHNKDNDILPGKKKGSKRITECSLAASNGVTMYIGSKSSKFRMRVYDKSAEVLSKKNEIIEPTLRLEAQVRKEVAEDMLKHMVFGVNAESLWHSVVDDHITYKQGELSKVLGIEQAERVEIDYSKVTGDTMNFEDWMRKQAGPTFERDYSNISDRDMIMALVRMKIISWERAQEWLSKMGE